MIIFSNVILWQIMDRKMDNRADWVDYGKGIGIILVVYAHLLSSGFHAGLKIPENFFVLSDSIVYSFHMPLFFFLSGLFVEGSFQKRGARDYLVDKFSRIAYPYLIWSVLQVSVEVIFSSQTQKGADLADLLAIPYKPWGQFWFVYALFLMHITYTIFSYFGKYSTALLFVTATVLYFNPSHSALMGLFGFSMHFIFFVSGIVYRKYLMNMEKQHAPLWVVVSLFIIFTGSAYFILGILIEPVRFASGAQRNPFYFLYLAVLGMAFCVCLAQYLSNKNGFHFLQTFGNYSLQIYLVHMLAGVGLRMVLLNVFGIQNWVIHLIAGVSFALITPIVLQKISDRFKFPYLFDFKRTYGPISS
jgi:fucose 4-O-acetylase-like acetyltransferase